MRTVGAFEAKTRFSELLDQVAAGKKIAITRHGRRVAMLTPARDEKRPEDIRRRRAEIRSLRKGVKLGGLTIKELVVAGRKH